MAGPGNGVSLEQVAERIDGMAQWAAGIEKQLNGVDIAVLWEEADEVAEGYNDVPHAIRKLERDKADKERELTDLKGQYALIEDQATLEAEGKNAEQRKANVRLALADDKNAVGMAKRISQLDFDVKIISAEIQEKERIWSDYHRQVVILAAKAGFSAYR